MKLVHLLMPSAVVKSCIYEPRTTTVFRLYTELSYYVRMTADFRFY